ncbi:c-type cytochrome [Limnofasciculus baicalensis]|uniref:Cytochrome c n=1 Tax=Limnofasciculus baicalensis BBK-W-15 TaxID=2699891 RepID=A0AAE3GUW4_9CYAN|nr:c-type cytochrome [Limnofasciculus baicalensis]MCP2731120.1 cytochrome c [Limnofasciculus baicalensis BBK-W-15]
MSESEKQKLLQKLIKKIWIFVIGIVLIVTGFVVWPLVSNNPVRYGDIQEHFKYGSIGSEAANGVPYWIWKVLPAMFPEKLPGEGYQSLGFIQEEGQDLPIGFSKRRVLFDRVGLNCAVCHTSTVRDTADSEPRIITTMPANTVNLMGYIKLLSATASDPRFNAREMIPQIEAIADNFNPIQKLIYRFFAIPQTRDALITQGERLAFLNEEPEWGPGRVDTFNPYKAIQFHFPMDRLDSDELIGTSDFPAIWNQKPRQGLQLHWDGDNDSVDERNLSAALGAGVTPTTVDLDGIKRVADWLWELPPPAYPYQINQELATVGEKLYENNCASCHAFGGAKVGTVTQLPKIGTDPYRLNSYTYELTSNQNTLYAGYPWRFSHFRKTNGYANMPLDGVWLRGPYLHNGSVPTLKDLLEVPENRPKEFYRGYDVFDEDNVGFVSDIAEENGKKYFKFDTTVPGNSNSGHLYGTELSPGEKDALVEYMKQL